MPFSIEIWKLRTSVERAIARADTVAVARATFQAAIAESPSRRLVLRDADRVIAKRA